MAVEVLMIDHCRTSPVRRVSVEIFHICRRVTRKCHHRELNPAPPCPESYAVTMCRAEKSVPIGDISHIYTPVLPEQRAPAEQPLLAR
jgi:hypothetical protein